MNRGKVSYAVPNPQAIPKHTSGIYKESLKYYGMATGPTAYQMFLCEICRFSHFCTIKTTFVLVILTSHTHTRLQVRSTTTEAALTFDLPPPKK